MKQVPLVNRVTAGRWTDSGPPEFPVDTIFLDPTIRCIGPSFALEVDGESMEPEFQTGDIVIIDTGVEPLPGDFVVAATDDNQGTFKKYRPRNVGPKGERVIDLVPLNQDYPILTLSEQNPGRIVGTMVEHRRFRPKTAKPILMSEGYFITVGFVLETLGLGLVRSPPIAVISVAAVLAVARACSL
jgi:SOS-response transcriptional repressor LexA